MKEIERLTCVPRKANYPVLALVETLSGLLHLQQGGKEGLISYLERFKSEQNVVLGLFGDKLLNTHVKIL